MATTGANINVTGATTATLTAQAMIYLTNLTDQQAVWVNSTTVTVNTYAAINPVTNQIANVNEFDLYINGQYIDKQLYTWTPSDYTIQTIVFDTAALGYPIESTDVIIINGRWI
jgi:hypothetical protein